MLARGILGSGPTGSDSFQPFLNSSGCWWLISSVFLIRISCHKTAHANGYYGAWPGWAVSVSVLPLTVCSGYSVLGDLRPVEYCVLKAVFVKVVTGVFNRQGGCEQ